MTDRLNRDAESLADVSRDGRGIAEPGRLHRGNHLRAREFIATIENGPRRRTVRPKGFPHHGRHGTGRVEMHAIGRNSRDVTDRGRRPCAKLTREDAQNTINSINKISESSRRIGDIVRMINDVSTRSTLSRNASIEAAGRRIRARIRGRGRGDLEARRHHREQHQGDRGAYSRGLSRIDTGP